MGFVDENLPIKIKTKHSTTKEKKEKKKRVKDERTQVLANKEFSQEDKSLSERMRTNQVLNWGAPQIPSCKKHTYQIKRAKEHKNTHPRRTQKK